MLYSSYHVAQRLSGKIPQGTIFFFFRVLISLLKKNHYQKLLIFFDGGGTNFRQSLLPVYKAQRPSMPSELFEQMEILKELLTKTNLCCLQIVDCEADDLIASFINQQEFQKNDSKVFDIFSRDKDLLQLLSPQTSILKYDEKGKIIFYSLDHFWQEYNFPPDNYVDCLSLIGDQVDNIAGVKGIGPVSAKKLIRQFRTVENIYQQLEQLPSNIQKLLVNQQDLVYRNKQIISLVKNISLPAEIDQKCNFEWEKWKDNSDLKDFCESNHFKSILKLLK
ncbi:MAG: 5'-3' exonuclease [Candidatus Moeniiplasma glomeromycotorum]|nr:5'-3' exonuclease [Candidatus Moeniiplasma glomeromycotorum]MCE8167336.1 5'-3' exonuclease [Candidatus Moeniiplasma glomeromycotorum]MCE8168651.1 5'-3' exonuclease [Candidatus Moeniiplasma glomeromycotorum]